LKIKTISPGQVLLTILSSTKLKKPTFFSDFSYETHRYLLTLLHIQKISNNFPIESLFVKNREAYHKTKDELGTAEFLIRNNTIKRKIRILIGVINKMSQHSHGGTILMTGDENLRTVQKNSLQRSIPLRAENSFESIKRKLRREEEQERLAQRDDSVKPTSFSYDREIEFLGQLTAVDGATLITDEFKIVAFGAKIKSKSKEIPEFIGFSEPFERIRVKPVNLSSLGGTRHQSAAQFVFDQKNDSIAIVASQDGKVSVICWDKLNRRVGVYSHVEYLFFDSEF
jgi:hypothetical protein